jgi:hypothetical protein
MTVALLASLLAEARDAITIKRQSDIDLIKKIDDALDRPAVAAHFEGRS